MFFEIMSGFCRSFQKTYICLRGGAYCVGRNADVHVSNLYIQRRSTILLRPRDDKKMCVAAVCCWRQDVVPGVVRAHRLTLVNLFEIKLTQCHKLHRPMIRTTFSQVS